MMMEKTGGQGDQCHVRISTNSWNSIWNRGNKIGI
jgi:hypothetical protein